MIKILHITASYKPAYVYGGPIYSIAALCEAFSGEERAKSKEQRLESSTLENEQRIDSSALENEQRIKNKEERHDTSSELKENNEREEYGILKPIQDEKDSSTELSTSVEVITTLANGKEELPYPSGEKREVEGVSVRYFKRWTKDHSHFSPALLWWLWKNAKEYDVIHIHSWWNLVSMGSVLVCLLKGIKPIVSPRGMLGDYTFNKGKLFFHQFIGKYLLRRCNFHATTGMEAEEIALKVWGRKLEDESLKFIVDEGVENGKWEVEKTGTKDERVRSKDKKLPSIFVIHNIVKLPGVLPKKTRALDGVLKLIFLSRIHDKKGIELLMDALAEVSFDFSLSIVGEGKSVYVESLKLKAESLKLSDRIVWMGPVYGEEKYKLLAEHDLFVLPSFNENFANVVVESLAVKTPVLISDKVGLCNYIQKYDLGLVHSNDLGSLTNTLTAFYNQPFLVKDIKKDFSPLHLQKQYLEMYDAI